MRTHSVLISGTGIAGSTLAYWLAEYGFKPTLIDRAPCLRASGYIIDFWGLGYDIAERMSLLSELEHKGYRVEEVRFVDGEGKRVGGFDAKVFRQVARGRYVSLLRGDLATLIYRKAECRSETTFGDSISAINQTAEGVCVNFQHASRRQFDLLVGADGLHSLTRQLVFGKRDFERYLGYFVAAFETQGYRPRDEGVYVSHSLPGKRIARFALRDDRTVFFFVFAVAQFPAIEPHDMSAQKALLHCEYARAGWECPQILEALDRSQDIYFDRVSQIRMHSWSRGRVALVGDAAFCPSLLAGQGSSLAMTGSYVLASELARQRESSSRHLSPIIRCSAHLWSANRDRHRDLPGRWCPRRGSAFSCATKFPERFGFRRSPIW